MEKTEVVERLNLNAICRACLGDHKNMKNMINNEQNIKEMFATLLNIELVQTESISSFICNLCEEKLYVSYGFLQQCQKSNEIFLEYLKVKETKIEETTEHSYGDTSNLNCDINSEDSDKEHRKNKIGRTRNKQIRRLKQYPFEEVAKAIERCGKKEFEYVQCIQCGFIGTNSRAISVHMSHLHKELKKRWCPHCNATFENMEQHNDNHKNDDFKCQFCSKVFTGKGHLTEHLRCHTDVRPYNCKTCGKCFISQRHLNVHHRVHSNEKPYKCRVCTKAFNQFNSLKVHYQQHEDNVGLKDDTENNMENQIMCESVQNYCGKCQKKVRSLVRHNKQMHCKVVDEFGDNVLDNKLCTVCGKQFKTSSKLKVHMRIHTGETPYKCFFCDKRVSTRNQLVVHERVHTGERPHVCHVCGKGFAQSSVLNTHMKLHTGRTEVCKICDQRCCRPAELRLHMRKHTGEKPYLCTDCGQAFIQRSHLVEHHKTHSNLRPYQCTYCDKAFKQNSTLKTHIQIHLGCKPFKCSQCPYACRQSYSLTQHMKHHTVDAPQLDRPHVCLICNKTFSTLAMLTSHVRKTHNVDTNL